MSAVKSRRGGRQAYGPAHILRPFHVWIGVSGWGGGGSERRALLLWQERLQIWPGSGDTRRVSGVIACVRFTRQLRSRSSGSAAAALGSRWYRPCLQSLLANSCFILWQFALMKSRRSSSDLCSLSIFNHVILIWGMS